MTIIFQDGGNFWIESMQISVTLPAIESTTQSTTTNLVRAGRYIGSMITPLGFGGAGDADESCGLTALLNQAGAELTYGNSITGVRVAQAKIAGGDTQVIRYQVVVFMRK